MRKLQNDNSNSSGKIDTDNQTRGIWRYKSQNEPQWCKTRDEGYSEEIEEISSCKLRYNQHNNRMIT